MKSSPDQFDFEKGELVLIDKPLEWTSFDVVKKIRNAVRIKKVGHAGTLDPLASGLLIIALGKATKKINELQNLDKSCECIIEIGKTTPSYDLETEFDSEKSIEGIDEDLLIEAAGKLTGPIDQVPPSYSAIKKDGKRAYQKARKGEEIKLESRKVTINHFIIQKIDLPEIVFEVSCSKGTYIRSLAHDFGALLGTGAYLKSLRRTKIGDYSVEDAYNLDDFVKIFKIQ